MNGVLNLNIFLTFMEKNSGPRKNENQSTKQQAKAVFKPVSCLLTADELDEKCDEQFSVIWNGANVPP